MAVRKLLGWNQTLLGARSATSMHTVRTFERSGHIGKLYGRTDRIDAAAAIRATLETAGIEFLPENGGGVSVRLRKPVEGKNG